MNNKKQNSKLILTALTVLTLAACSSAPPPTLVIDPSMANAEVLKVDGFRNRYWSKPLTFGPYRTEKTRTSQSWRWSAGLFGREIGAKIDPYRFIFVDDAGERYQVECRSRTPMLRRSTRHSEWSFPIGETQLGCAIQDPAGDIGSIGLRGFAGDYSGETGFGDIEDFEINALHKFASSEGREFQLPVAIGYELRQHGKVVATVDTFGDGEVYLNPELGPRQRSAAALTLTVLMFFDEA